MTALAQINVSLPKDEFEALPVEHKEKIKLKWPKWFNEDGSLKYSWELTNQVVDSAEMVFLSEVGIKYQVERFKGIVPADLGLVPDGAQVQIHLPNFQLHAFNRVTWLEDSCTEVLQQHLDEGWRILAICPPMNERRPTYIIGKCV